MPSDDFDCNSVVACLRRARDLVARPGGWKQGDSDWNRAVYCAEGATYEAMVLINHDCLGTEQRLTIRPDSSGRSLCDHASAYLYAAVPTWFVDHRKQCVRAEGRPLDPSDPKDILISYNDLPEQTQTRVLDWFDTAIAAASVGRTDARMAEYVEAAPSK